MSRSLAGSGSGLLLVLIGFLVLAYIAASTLGQSVANSLFALVVLSFVALIALILAGVRGSGRMDF